MNRLVLVRWIDAVSHAPKGCIVHMETLRRSKGEKPK